LKHSTFRLEAVGWNGEISSFTWAPMRSLDSTSFRSRWQFRPQKPLCSATLALWNAAMLPALPIPLGQSSQSFSP